MKILLIDNGSGYLEKIKSLTAGHQVEVFGYPFVPAELAERAAGSDLIIFSGEPVPAGIDLPYYSAELEALAGLSLPVFGIGQGAAVLLEANGGRVRTSGGKYFVKKAPAGWQQEGEVWQDDKGNLAVFGDGWEEVIKKRISE